jgi:hypothetical protein
MQLGLLPLTTRGSIATQEKLAKKEMSNWNKFKKDILVLSLKMSTKENLAWNNVHSGWILIESTL